MCLTRLQAPKPAVVRGFQMMAKNTNPEKETIDQLKSPDKQTFKLRHSREAYLKPLLERHNRNEAITFEDLETSFEAGKTAAKEYTELAKQSEVLENLKELHLSQLNAYKSAARISLKRIADEYTVPPIAESTKDSDDDSNKTPIVNETEQNRYIEKCIEEASHLSKGWKVDKGIVDECLINEIKNKVRKYLEEREKINSLNLADGNEKTEKSNTKQLKSSEEKLPTIDECVESNDEVLEKDTQQCVEDGEITSEEENDDGSKSSQNDNSVKSTAKQDNNASKSKTLNPRTKISLQKVNQKKRQLNSLGQNKLKKIKMINGNSNSNNGAMNSALSTSGKRGRGGRGRGRQWRRGGKN